MKRTKQHTGACNLASFFYAIAVVHVVCWGLFGKGVRK